MFKFLENCRKEKKIGGFSIVLCQNWVRINNCYGFHFKRFMHYYNLRIYFSRTGSRRQMIFVSNNMLIYDLFIATYLDFIYFYRMAIRSLEENWDTFLEFSSNSSSSCYFLLILHKLQHYISRTGNRGHVVDASIITFDNALSNKQNLILSLH